MAKIDTQDNIPGIESDAIEEIEDLAKELYEIRSDRMKLTAKESQVGERLTTVMRERKLRKYVCKKFTGGFVAIKPKDGWRVSVKVKKPKAEKEKKAKK